MQKQKDNLFLEKFRLLNSQEYSEDIKWSLSSSSDYEDTCNEKINNSNKYRNSKRKRKKVLSKNTSNLDITIVDTCKDHKTDYRREKSPILSSKCVETPMSPILTSNFPLNRPSSPILNKSLHQKSPILRLKIASPKFSTQAKKKLCYNLHEAQNKLKCYQHSSNSHQSSNGTISCTIPEYQVENKENLLNKIKKEVDSADINEIHIDNQLNKEFVKNIDLSISSSNAKDNLLNNVRKYFNSHFSSENSSQNISVSQSPEECLKHEEIDILSCKTQANTSVTLKHENTSSDCSSLININSSKKVKYKKGGMSFRLNVLLKKQQASVSLWQHERFLATNSKFVIPKGEPAVFCVKNIEFKYGCFLINVIDGNNEKYSIIVNSFYVNDNITTESVFKLYEPYLILAIDKDLKIIVNVNKFECIQLNSL